MYMNRNLSFALLTCIGYFSCQIHGSKLYFKVDPYTGSFASASPTVHYSSIVSQLFCALNSSAKQNGVSSPSSSNFGVFNKNDSVCSINYLGREIFYNYISVTDCAFHRDQDGCRFGTGMMLS